MKLRRAAIWACVTVLAATFGLVGVSKMAGASAARWSERLSHWGYPPAARIVIGVLEIVAGVGVVIPASRRAAATAIVVLMVGAIGTHLVHSEFPRMVPPVVLGALAAALVYTPFDVTAP
jgi:uncharacterized membrane protein YphA (DoxX/SURF4 family)